MPRRETLPKRELPRASIKSGTWNIPEHSKTSKNQNVKGENEKN